MGIKIGSIFTGEQQQQQQQQLSQMVPQPIAETTSGAPLLPSTEGSAGSMDSHGRRSPNALAYRGNSSPRMLDVALQEGQARLVEYYVPEVRSRHGVWRWGWGLRLSSGDQTLHYTRSRILTSVDLLQVTFIGRLRAEG